MSDKPDWIAEFLAYDDERRRNRRAHALAKAIYPTAWGDHGEPDASGHRQMKPGIPRTALGWATLGLDAADRAA